MSFFSLYYLIGGGRGFEHGCQMSLRARPDPPARPYETWSSFTGLLLLACSSLIRPRSAEDLSRMQRLQSTFQLLPSYYQDRLQRNGSACGAMV
jgi:hypothetical protein